MMKILSAVKHMHDHGVCHRDLKPENFIFKDKSEDAEIKIIDFGLSKKFEKKDTHGEMKTIVGTPFYVAPDVLGGNYTEACDYWSLGVIMYVLLCGYPPFDADTSKQIFKKILHEEVQFDPEDWDDISDDAKDLITQLLQKIPENRATA